MQVQKISSGLRTPDAEAHRWESRLLGHVQNESTELVRLLSLFAQPDVLSLALGLPATELLPAAEVARATESLLASGPGVLQMGPTSAALRERVVALMARRGVSCQPDQVMLTTGAQQALYLVCRAFLDQNADVLIEEVTYPGMLAVLAQTKARIHRAPVDPLRGTDVDAIEAVLRGGGRPAFLYLIPEGHNPLGTTLSLADRKRMVELARRYGVPIVEDSPYAFLQHEGDVPAPLYALDPDNVIHIGSFSKLFGPALRTGWMVVPAALRNAFSRLKDAIDTDSSPLVARVIARVLDDESFVSQHLAGLGRAFGERKQRLLAGLQRALPHCTWTTPTCGLFVWLRLPDNVQPKALLEKAIERERLAFMPGSMFGEGAAAQHGIRLSYGTAPLDQLEEGALRLGRLLGKGA